LPNALLLSAALLALSSFHLFTLLSTPGLVGILALPTTLSQEAPHLGQQPCSLVPASIQGSMRAGGYVAKCAPW
jgi:hypothetical protein